MGGSDYKKVIKTHQNHVVLQLLRKPTGRCTPLVSFASWKRKSNIRTRFFSFVSWNLWWIDHVFYPSPSLLTSATSGRHINTCRVLNNMRLTASFMFIFLATRQFFVLMRHASHEHVVTRKRMRRAHVRSMPVTCILCSIATHSVLHATQRTTTYFILWI